MSLTLILSKYSQAINDRPVLTKASTSGVLYILQEVLASLMVGSKPESKKALKMSFYGFFISGPLSHYLYTMLENVAKNSSKPAIVKLLASNLIISPILNAFYLVALSLFSGAHLQAAILIMRKRLISMMRISWTVSPIAQIIAFRYFDPKFYVTFFNFIAFVFGLVINTQAKLETKKRSGKPAAKKKN